MLLERDNIQSFFIYMFGFSGCLTSKDVAFYRSIADETGGEVLLFGNGGHVQLKKMGAYVRHSLDGLTLLPVGSKKGSSRNKRSTKKIYSVVVDDSLDVFTAAIITNQADSNVELTNPKGQLQLSGKTQTGQGTLYVVNSPSPGTWDLSIPSTVSNEVISARGSSKGNIDFDYYFITEVPLRKRKGEKVISKSLIKGKNSILTESVMINGLVPSLSIQSGKS